MISAISSCSSAFNNSIIDWAFSFSNIFKIQSLKTDNPNVISKSLGINYYFVNDYINASKKFSIKEVVKIIRILNKYDLKSKGINFEGNSDLLINQLIAEIKN